MDPFIRNVTIEVSIKVIQGYGNNLAISEQKAAGSMERQEIIKQVIDMTKQAIDSVSSQFTITERIEQLEETKKILQIPAAQPNS